MHQNLDSQTSRYSDETVVVSEKVFAVVVSEKVFAVSKVKT